MTRSLGDSESRETPRVIGLSLLTLAVATGSSFLVHKLGFTWAWDAMHRGPFWQGLVFSVALWSAALLACLHARRLLAAGAEYAREPWPGWIGAIARFFRSAPAVTARMIFAALAAMFSLLQFLVRATAVALSPLAPVLAAIARIIKFYCVGFWLIAQPFVEPAMPRLRCALSAPIAWAQGLSLAPLRALWARAVSPLFQRTSMIAQAAQFEWKLWRTYRAEFRGAFASYLEFKREFKARMSADPFGSDGNDPQATSPDPFAAACKAMALSENGNFTEGEFKARYRALMKKAHPDMGGSQERAAQINAASMEIRKRKGWS